MMVRQMGVMVRQVPALFDVLELAQTVLQGSFTAWLCAHALPQERAAAAPAAARARAGDKRTYLKESRP